MAKTYNPISTQTLGSAAASVTFSSIPATYTDLVLVCQSGEDTSDYLAVQFNSDTATNYSYTSLNGDGSTATSVRASTQSRGLLSWYTYTPANTLNSASIAHIMNYANTTTNKTYLSRFSSGNGAELIAGLWRSTAAINTIKLFPLTGSFRIGSTFTLYGILAA